MTEAYILLDRDGVINIDSDDYIKSPEEWQPIEKSLEAIALLNEGNYKVVVITNQSGLSRGFYNEAMLDKIHDKMHRMVKTKGGKIHSIYYCPHGPDDDCLCRKPKPGLLHRFSKDTKTCLSDIYFIGDKLSDAQAAISAGAKPLLVKTGKGQKPIQNSLEINIPIFEDLYDAAKFILSEK